MGLDGEDVKTLWDAWNLRGCIMLSLFLQVFLVLLASLRQRYRSALLRSSIWLAYLLADWVAAAAIGSISRAQALAKPDNNNLKQELSALWASFLLVHLGGPDTITSFALEDNEFWVRHLFGLLIQGAAAVYIFCMTKSGNKLWPPTVSVFIVGVVKYGERIRALYLATLDHFGSTVVPQADPGPDYEEASASYSLLLLQAPVQAEMTTVPSDNTVNAGPSLNLSRTTSLQASDEVALVRVAKKLFDRFKGVIVGFYLTTRDRDQSRSLFLKLDHKSAFRLVEYELSFMYHVLHTKTVVARSWTIFVLRVLCFVLMLISLFYFRFLFEKKDFHRFEIGLTYALLYGAIALDVISFVKFVFSDWTLSALEGWAIESWAKYINLFILIRSKWSKMAPQYNMVSYCVDEPPNWLNKLAGYLHASDIVTWIKIWRYSSSDNVTEDLEKFIFEELKRKSEAAKTMREALEASLQRGDAALAQSSLPIEIKLKWTIGEFQYAESLLLWHIATQICCWREEKEVAISEKRRCRVLSDYMFYLLIKQPTMMSPILGNWNVVFQDTFAEGKRFFDKYKVRKWSKALDQLVAVKAKYRPTAVKGLTSKSVFFDSCILAQQLLVLEVEERWTVMERIWAEFMCYAAVNCKPIVHAQQPSRGGELLTMSWAMMSHLGLGLHFSEEEDQSGTKMVAVK